MSSQQPGEQRFGPPSAKAPLADLTLSLDLTAIQTKRELAKKDRVLRTAQDEAKLDEAARGFRDRQKTEAKRLTAVTDSEYWFAVCFTTREQKEAFLKALHWDLATGGDDKYLDGVALAQKIGVVLPPAALHAVPPPAKGFEGLVLDL